MAIDPSIPLQARGVDAIQMLADGDKLSQLWRQQKSDQELNRIYNESQGDVNKMLNLGQQSQMARYIVPQLQAQQTASQKNLLDQQKTLAEIGKTTSEATKNNAQAGGYTLDNSQKKFGAIQGAFQQAALTGDKGQVLLALDAMKRTGIISPEDYDHNVKIVSIMKPEEVKQYGMNSGLLNKELAPYLYQTKNNEADNATLTENSIRTAKTVEKSLEQQDKQFQKNFDFKAQQDYFERNKPVSFGVDVNGRKYAILPDGKSKYIKDDQGNYIVEKQSGNGQPKLSDKALQLVNDLNVQLSTASQNSGKINGLISDVQSGRLNLSAANQLGAKAKNMIGLSDENSRGVENFQTALNQAVNDVLMMAKGTQTEGDAQRAAQVIAANPPRDNAAALQALQRLAAVQNNTIAVLNQNINGIYDNYGLSRSQGAPKQTAQAGANQAKLNNILFGK
ncbi:hypothetical protein [Acinetobacter sp. 1124_18A]|uniref:hypothetical protein n=1 Tax=Acinetobacter sp. 1124_18A TaxID=2605958 RepID=UPI00405849E3